MFGRKINSEEYEKLSKANIEIMTALNNCINKIATMETNINSLRGLVNRKLGKIEEDQQSQDINTPKYY